MPEVRELVEEEDPLVRFVDRARDYPLVRERAELRVAAVRIVPDVPEKFRLGSAGRHDERVAVEFDEDLAGTLLLEVPSALERSLVEDLDLVAGPFVGDNLLHAVLEVRRPDGLLGVSPRADRKLEDPADEVAERI